MYKSIDKHDCAYNIDEFPTNKELIMPLTLPNTTLNLSTVDQLKAVYEYVVAELSLVDPPNPFTNGLLRQSDQDIAKLIHEVISLDLTSAAYDPLPPFTISDHNNDTLVSKLVEQVNASIANGTGV